MDKMIMRRYHISGTRSTQAIPPSGEPPEQAPSVLKSWRAPEYSSKISRRVVEIGSTRAERPVNRFHAPVNRLYSRTGGDFPPRAA